MFKIDVRQSWWQFKHRYILAMRLLRKINQLEEFANIEPLNNIFSLSFMSIWCKIRLGIRTFLEKKNGIDILFLHQVKFPCKIIIYEI